MSQFAVAATAAIRSTSPTLPPTKRGGASAGTASRATVRELADAVHGHGKPITAAVFPTPAIARRLVRQAWDEWPLDRVFPMLYHSFYLEDIPWIGDGVREGMSPRWGRRP